MICSKMPPPLQQHSLLSHLYLRPPPPSHSPHLLQHLCCSQRPQERQQRQLSDLQDHPFNGVQLQGLLAYQILQRHRCQTADTLTVSSPRPQRQIQWTRAGSPGLTCCAGTRSCVHRQTLISMQQPTLARSRRRLQEDRRQHLLALRARPGHEPPRLCRQHRGRRCRGEEWRRAGKAPRDKTAVLWGIGWAGARDP